MKKNIIISGISVFCILCIIMIYIGMDGKALAPRQESFTYAKGTKLSTDASTYLKGVVDDSRIKLDLSNVDTDVPGSYQVTARQASRTYTFTIIIK